MNISAKTEYACRALLELSLQWPNVVPRQIADIAAKQKIPTKFLIHILIELKGLGYVDSTRGKSGGYYLTVSPQTIKLVDVIRHFGGIGSADAGRKKAAKQDILSIIWREIDAAVLKALGETTFETIANRHRSQGKAMMFDI